MLRYSVVVVVVAVVRTRPRAMPLAMQNHEKINSWVSFSFLYEYGAPLGGPGAPFQNLLFQPQFTIQTLILLLELGDL